MTTLSRCVNGHEWAVTSGEEAGPRPRRGSGRTHAAHAAHLPRAASPSDPQRLPGTAPPDAGRVRGDGGTGAGRHGHRLQGPAPRDGRRGGPQSDPQEGAGNADLISRFKREAMALARMHTLKSCAGLRGRTDRRAAVPRHRVRARLACSAGPGRGGGPLPVATAYFIRQTALALEHADEQRLVHRGHQAEQHHGCWRPRACRCRWRPVVKVLDMGVVRFFQAGDHEAP